MLSLAAARGLDEIEVIRPPVVGVLVLGSDLLDRGLPRPGRVRDALRHAVPAFVGALGARGNPAVRAPDSPDLLLQEIDDANVDILVTTGSTAPGPDNHLRRARGPQRPLAGGRRRGLAGRPDAPCQAADGRFLVGLPGEPVSALAGLVTLVSPLIRALRADAISGQAHRRS